ncbi:MAG: helix-turn-helix domain-containing protein, partial [Luteimonas sp.]
EKLADQGRFRHDLYYRINVIELQVPPLRDRRGDLHGLADAILKRLAIAHARSTPALSADALQALHAHAFPGNVRELENILERAMAMADGDTIEADDLRLPAARTLEPAPSPPAASVAVDPSTLDPRETSGSALPMYIEQLERAAIEKALQDNRYNKTKAAASLGITFRALRYKLKKLGID